MKTVLLSGKTRHGKNRIQQHGKEWFVERIGRFGGEPAMLLRSSQKTDKGDFDGRWVLLNDDGDFAWEEING